MQLNKFLEFPAKKGSVKIPTNELLNDYRGKYDLLKKKLTSSVYRNGGSHYVIVAVPSESVDKFAYDVVIEFTDLGKSLEDSHIKIFSNSPSFVYTFAYVFYHLADENSKGMIIDGFDKKIPKDRLLSSVADTKLGKEVLHAAPAVRNPYGLPLFDKTIYYAIFHILEKYNPSTIKTKSKPVTGDQLDKMIMSFEKTMLLRSKLEIEQKKREVKKDMPAGTKIRKGVLDALDNGDNVSIRHTKKGANIVRTTHSSNVTKVKAANTSIQVIKKMR